MQKIFSKKYFYSTVLFVSVLFLCLGCEKDDTTNQEIKNVRFKTVSFKTASEFLINESDNLLRTIEQPYVTIYTNYIVHEDLTNTDEMITVVAAKTRDSLAYSRVLLLEIDNEIQSVVFSMYSFNNFTSSQFSGNVFVTDMQGNLLNGFRVVDGNYITQYIVPDTTSNSSNRGTGCDECTYSDCSWCSLDEVVITSPQKKVSIGSVYPSIVPQQTEDETPNIDAEWGSGGGTEVQLCPAGYVLDASGSCQPANDPCTEISAQNITSTYSGYLTFLKGKTSESKEYGFAQKVDGSYIPLNERANNNHTLIIPPGASYIGFIHSHKCKSHYFNDPYTGEPKEVKSIQMFSPQDLSRFLSYAYYASINSNISISQVYGTLVSCSVAYTIRFTGSTINTGFNASGSINDYLKIFEENESRETAFLKYLQQTNNTGVSLYKLNDDGTTSELTLDDNGNAEPNPC